MRSADTGSFWGMGGLQATIRIIPTKGTGERCERLLTTYGQYSTVSAKIVSGLPINTSHRHNGWCPRPNRSGVSQTGVFLHMKNDRQQLEIEWVHPMLIIKNSSIYERPTWRDALSVARLFRKRIELTAAGETLRDLMLHGY